MNRQKSFQLISVLVLLAMLAACNYPGRGTSSLPSAAYTQAAKTVAAQLTEVISTPVQQQATLPAINKTQAPLLTRTPVSAPPTATFTPPATATQPQAATPTENMKLIYSTDFSEQTGWYTTENDNYGFKFTNGGYEIYVNLIKANIWSIREKSYKDIVLEVNGQNMGGPEDGFYGLMCRQVDGNNYYAFVIGSNGFYGIGKMLNGDFQFLKSETDQTGTIKKGPGVFNRIRADCRGDTLRLDVNGQRMIETTDSDFKEGVSGLIAGTQKNPGLQALFDDFAIYQPLS